MTESDFDSALIAAALRLAAEDGWRRISVAAAARAAGLPLNEARARFPGRHMILLRFGALADQAALTDAPAEGPVRDRLFDLLMRRFDAFQAHRDGVIAVMRTLPFDPPLALMLACATERSMRWMLEAAGIALAGPRGDLTVKGCVGVWLWTLRAWERDASEDLSGTMAALDTALQRAERLAGWLGGGPKGAKPPPEADEGAGEASGEASEEGSEEGTKEGAGDDAPDAPLPE
ncbi:MAG TPA: TetR family transcriptional regulator [Rhodopila sp.]|uniref:TetR family transcriptional regulator n=1 Tax=Rhodopila sp. TaxID=2480087 RepID=UPI002BC8A4BF|nr:TetR family transcriptional regulator [Rhodopila sp.]HVY15741.1 TetR family transcriptional regulator [Rhodopila sp.]